MYTRAMILFLTVVWYSGHYVSVESFKCFIKGFVLSGLAQLPWRCLR